MQLKKMSFLRRQKSGYTKYSGQAGCGSKARFIPKSTATRILPRPATARAISVIFGILATLNDKLASLISSQPDEDIVTSQET